MTSGNFSSPNGTQYYHQSHTTPNPIAEVVILHGYADHCGRFDHVARYFNDHDLSVFSFDLRGHGQSSGKRVFIRSFNEYVEDLSIMTDFYFKEIKNSSLPTFLYSHSTGTLIALQYLEDHQSKFAGWISTGGLIKANEDISPILVKMSGLLSKLTPGLRTIGLDLNDLSRNPAIKPKAENDPHYDHGGIRARTGAEILRATKGAKKLIPAIEIPLLIFHGENDKLSVPEGSQWLYDLSSSKDKTLKFWTGAYHELVNEPNRTEIMGEMVRWMKGLMH